MKKMYGAPKAEKVEFSYSESVVASITKKCTNVTPMTESGGSMCTERPAGETVFNDHV